MATILTMDGSAGKFLINGRPTFLLGASYYGGLALDVAAAKPDLVRLRELGFNWIRLWCTWAAFDNDVSAVDQAGQLREPYCGRLLDYCRLADELGMIVDVTFARSLTPEQAASCEALRLASLKPWMITPISTHQAHLTAVRNITEALRDFRNVYIDVNNERDSPREQPVSLEDAGELIRLVHELDGQRLATVSHAQDIPDSDMAGYVQTAGVDFLTPHRPRHEKSPAETEARTGHYRRLAAELGRAMPVHYQEPFRRAFTPWQPTVDDFLTDLRNSVTSGAAGWCFHNGYSRNGSDGHPRRSFDLRGGALFDQLDEIELAVLQQVGGVVAAAVGR